MIGILVGHYRIFDRLGAGGMGVIYRAEDVRLGPRSKPRTSTASSTVT